MPDKPTPDISARDSTYAALEAWLRERRRYTLVALVTIAFVLRVACFLQLAASPFFWIHEWKQSDMNTFHCWALAIAEGDWWFRSAAPPLHNWHRRIAEDYAREFPQSWAELQAAHQTDDPDQAARALWYHWFGGGRTYQGPLYPYLIAGTYALLGPAVGWVFAWQMLLGIASIVLVYRLGREYFGDVAAVLAAVFVLFYGPLLFYELVLLRVTLIVFCGLLLVFLLERARANDPALPLGKIALRWMWVGVLLGLCLALKAHFLLMVFASVGLLVAQYWKRWGRLGWCGGALLAGLLVGFSPVVVRNVVVGAPPFVTASSGPPTFLISNAQGASQSSWDTRHAARILGETGGALVPTVIATLKTHPTVSSYLRLLGQKALATWYWYEEPNNANFHYAQLHSSVLRALPISFGMIGPLALVGLVLALRRSATQWPLPYRRPAPLYFLVLTNLIVLHVFFVFARFRVPLAAALTPFAAFAVARLICFVLSRRWKPAAAIVAVSAALGLYTLAPAVANQPTTRLVDVAVAYRVYYDVRLQSALTSGDLGAAAAVLGESLRHQPAEVLALGSARPATSREEAELAAFYAEIYRRYAVILEEAGYSGEAEKQRRRSAELLEAAGEVLTGETS
jgi:4-amino-4-deoxy-L-arabinose transferase-like glycosyltransferase